MDWLSQYEPKKVTPQEALRALKDGYRIFITGNCSVPQTIMEALKAALADGADFGEAMQRSADAAKQGMEATIPLIARKGRASYLGERSAGHQDPGATSSYLLLDTLAKAWA